MLDKAMKTLDVGRGYDQLSREVKGLMNIAKEITTKINRFQYNITMLRRSIDSDGEITKEQRNKLMKDLEEAFNYIGNHTEV